MGSSRNLAVITVCGHYSARLCLPWKLAQILEGTRAKGSAEQTSMASALADMFPPDLAPLIDMSGKMWAHTVSTHTSSPTQYREYGFHVQSVPLLGQWQKGHACLG